MSYLIGVDTGGTFTDAVIIDEKGKITRGKTPTNYKDFADGVSNALTLAAKNIGLPLEQVLGETRVFCFGTTVGTNAIVTHTGAKTGMLTTNGAEDTIFIGRGALRWAGLTEGEARHIVATVRPSPFIPKHLVKTIQERVDYQGKVLCKLSPEEVTKSVESLVKEGIESIAVCFLWSFQNNDHEKEAKKIISELYPNIYCSTSHEISPLLGEYERFVTTALDCYIGPNTSKFLNSLSMMLKHKGLKTRLLVMKADGGSAYSDQVLPVATLNSGPAGGVTGARYIGKLLGYKNIISSDVGGTSFDVSIIRNAEIPYSREPVVEHYHTMNPSIDVISIGAGGGSIIWVDPETNMLHVGPRSAGASPGPVCYGTGGTEPTMTDATLTLGYLNPDFFLGGTMKIYPDKAIKALDKIGSKIGMDANQVAAGAYDIINARMADLLTGATVRRGHDVREFTLFSFGGAGPVHAAALGDEVGIKEIVVPWGNSVYSAIGLATSSLLHSRVKYGSEKLPMDMGKFNQSFEELEAAISDDLERDGVAKEDRTIRYFLDMKYGLQIHVVRLEIQHKRYGTDDADFIASAFDRAYDEAYGKGAAFPSAGRIITAFVVTSEAKPPELRLVKRKMEQPDPSGALKGQRKAFFKKSKGFVPTNIYDYDKLRPGNVVTGPAIIEATDTTVVVLPDFKSYMDEYQNIKITQLK